MNADHSVVMAITSYSPDSKVEPYKVAIIVSQFNEIVTEALLKGTLNQMRSLHVSDEQIQVFYVPGAFEIPLFAKRILSQGKVDGVITLGAVIKGETAHFDFVAGPCASQLAALAVEFSKPVIFGVLTTDSLDQALHRAGGKYGNKGAEAATTLHDTLSVLQKAGV